MSKSIYQAAAENDVEALRRVIHRLHIPDPDTGWTALHYAAEQNALEAAQLLLDYGADPEAEDPRGVRPGDVASGEAVRALLVPEELRVASDDPVRTWVLVTHLLVSLGDAEAAADWEALGQHGLGPMRTLFHKQRLGHRPLHRDHGVAGARPLSEQRLADVQAALRDRAEDSRQAGLDWALQEPDERLASDVARSLNGRALELLPVAARAFRMCHSREEAILEGLRPFLEIEIPLDPIPPGLSEEETKALKKKNAEKAAKQYDIRRYAARALMYPHGSRATQEYLLDYFADPERQLKRELNVALQYCPDPEAVQAALLGLVEKADPLRTSALFALTHFKNREHRELFLKYLQSDQAETARAALRGLQPHLQASDLGTLQECRDRWRS